MQDLIKRNFWVLGVLAVMVCAVFAAKATGHLIEATALGDSKTGPKIAPVVREPVTPVKTVSKDGTQFETRNMFCSDCTPPVAVAVNTDPSSIQNTTLPLVLVATMVSPKDEADSYATIINNDSQKQGAYSIGDPIPGATGKLKAIRFQYIEFENNGRVERLALLGAAPPPVATVAATPPSSSDGEENKDDLQAMVDSGIKKIDDNTYEIDKSLVEKVLANPMAIAKGARVVPAVKNGKPDGFKLYAIRPSSAFAKLGLSNGDTLQSINGFELTSADKALEVYTKLREATSLEMEVTRRGKPITLKYTIR